MGMSLEEARLMLQGTEALRLSPEAQTMLGDTIAPADRDAAAEGMTETQLEDKFLAKAHELGYLAVHFRAALTTRTRMSVKDGKVVESPLYVTPGKGDVHGYPDWFLLHVGMRRVMWVELKKEDGKVSADQAKWRAALLAAGKEYYLLRPSDWYSGRIESLLKGEGTRC